MAKLTPRLLAALLLGLSFLAQPAHGQTTDAEIDRLARDPFWLKLVHHKDSISFTGDSRSDVLTPDFFLSPKGAQDPRAELVATIAALRTPMSADPDRHARCRFPARYAWLSGQLHWSAEALGPAKCPAFDAWRGAAPITGASLIFASGYLQNPASYYGHLLLKLNTSQAETPAASLFDKTLNYGAIYPDHQNPLLYVYRGLTGGYRSSYSDLQFFNHQEKYTESELRDVWEYELELDPSQTAYLVAHSWEVLRTQNRYFYLKQNCAYRLAELVNLVIDEPLTPPDKGWVMPIDVFDQLMRERPGARPLVRHVRRIESRQSEFRQAYLDLSLEDRAVVRAFIMDKAPSTDSLKGLLPDQRRRIVDTLIDYYSYRQGGVGDPDPDAPRLRNDLLLARLRMPPGPEAAAKSPGALPHEGQRSSMVQVSLTSNSNLGTGGEVRFRAAYRDFLTFVPGAPADSELSMVDIRLRHVDGRLDLRNFDLLRVTALNLSPTGLPRDGGAAWKVRFGAEDQDLACSRCLEAFAEGGWGRAAQVSNSTSVYAFLNGRVNGKREAGAYFEAGPSAGVIFGPTQIWRANVEVGLWRQLDGAQESRPVARAEVRFGSTPTWDFRAGIEYQNVAGQDVSEGRLSLSRYW